MKRPDWPTRLFCCASASRLTRDRDALPAFGFAVPTRSIAREYEMMMEWSN